MTRKDKKKFSKKYFQKLKEDATCRVRILCSLSEISSDEGGGMEERNICSELNLMKLEFLNF